MERKSVELKGILSLGGEALGDHDPGRHVEIGGSGGIVLVKEQLDLFMDAVVVQIGGQVEVMLGLAEAQVQPEIEIVSRFCFQVRIPADVVVDVLEIQVKLFDGGSAEAL